MKIREDYENVAWRRFVRWVNGDEQPQKAEKQDRTHREKTGYKEPQTCDCAL